MTNMDQVDHSHGIKARGAETKKCPLALRGGLEMCCMPLFCMAWEWRSPEKERQSVNHSPEDGKPKETLGDGWELIATDALGQGGSHLILTYERNALWTNRKGVCLEVEALRGHG